MPTKNHPTHRISAITTAAVTGLTLAACMASTAPEIEHKETTRQAFYTHTIEGYSDQQSVIAGQTINFYVSSTTTDYTVTIRRHGIPGAPPVSGPTSYSNGAVRPIPPDAAINGANWAQFGISFPVSVPGGVSAWKSGLYTAKLEQPSTGSYFYIPFIVRDAPGTEKSIALLASTNTWTAYNFWPYTADTSVPLSIYDGCPGEHPHTDTVSLLRPNPNASPDPLDYACQDPVVYPYFLNRTEHLLAGEVRIAEWLDRQTSPARPYSVLTDVDLHNGGASALTPFSTVIISTHSEYWSPAMRTALDSYLRAGGNVVSLSGNTMYHIVDFDASGHMTKRSSQDWLPSEQAPVLGVANTGNTPVVCNDYKVRSSRHWAIPAALAAGTSIGASGVITQLVVPPHASGDHSRTFCTNGGSGAAGWEFDYKYPVYARTYNHVADSATGSDIVYMRRASAGQVFSVGSITFGQSLLQEELTGGYLPGMIRNVLARFSTRSFSDFGGDGKPDLIARNPSSGQLVRYDGNGTGGLVQNGGAVLPGNFGQYNALIAPGDFDGDGKPDLLARDLNGTLWLFRGNGTGGFISTTGTQADSGWNVLNSIVGVGDWDGDGRNDLVARDSSGSLLLYRGNGTGGFFAGSQFMAYWGGYDLTIPIGDFDGDGNPDLLARTPAGGLFRCSGDGVGGFKNASPCTSIDSGWQIFNAIIPVGSFSGDGVPTLLARDGSGNLRRYRGTGAGTIVPGYVTIDSGWGVFDAILGIW